MLLTFGNLTAFRNSSASWEKINKHAPVLIFYAEDVA